MCEVLHEAQGRFLMEARTLTLVMPLPAKAGHPNARAHWRAVARARAADRQCSAMFATSAKIGRKWNGNPFHKATLDSHFILGNYADSDNLIAWLKGMIDGLADAGVVTNDKHLIPLPPTQEIRRGKNSHLRGVTLTIKEIL